ncbi:MAG TPA: TetR/AcrR family transcriptional regulator [Candidatus Scatomorpha intestinavium]|uniref:TetR/AcrR family transcriptional regulator n=1 Tax=Candidatus Scatomorpha intestinavium TaxID=2840922 RepID=A0A9D0ZF74_9FIRM|nr:TetR/AcrR family transcriptional regulator [Candidatus Scatomorpha intestinavium]
MARNKYPEVTVERILDAAQRLFLEKGYENTTIQDIVNELGGLTKGAVYHHFRSKEEIMEAVNDRMFFSNNPFEAVQERSDLTGLEKLRQAVVIHNADEEQGEITRQAAALMKNPQMLAGMLVSNREILTPYYRKLIDEGIADGSITTRYPREISELLPILTSLWFIPGIYPATREEQRRKFSFIFDMLDAMGLTLRDERIEKIAGRFFDSWPEE